MASQYSSLQKQKSDRQSKRLLQRETRKTPKQPLSMWRARKPSQQSSTAYEHMSSRTILFRVVLRAPSTNQAKYKKQIFKCWSDVQIDPKIGFSDLEIP